MQHRSFRPPDLVVAALAVFAVAGIFSVISPLAGMGLAVLSAVSWCLWLDRAP